MRPDAGCCEEDGAWDDDAGKQVVVHGQNVGAGPRVQEPDTAKHSSQILSQMMEKKPIFKASLKSLFF